MKLYLVRHGEAGEHSIDAERQLSERGISQVKRLAEYFAECHAKPGTIYHSGLVRARQTADIIARRLAVDDVQTMESLAFTRSITLVGDAIEGWDKDTLLVGHVPYMGQLLSYLTDQHDSITFDTATGVCLEKQEAGRWTVEWVFHGSEP